MNQDGWFVVCAQVTRIESAASLLRTRRRNFGSLADFVFVISSLYSGVHRPDLSFCIFLFSFWKHARVWILYRQSCSQFLGFGCRTKQSRYIVMAWRWGPNLSPERSVVFTVYFLLALWIFKQQVLEANNPKSVLANSLSHTTNFEVRHPRCVSQNHKIKQQTLESQNTTIYIYIYIWLVIR